MGLKLLSEDLTPARRFNPMDSYHVFFGNDLLLSIIVILTTK